MNTPQIGGRESKPFWDSVFGQIVIGVMTGLVVAAVVKK